VLVVDDDRAVRDALRRALTLGGYEVRLAEDGSAGLQEAMSATPEAVVLDVGMPGIDGLEVCRRLRSQGNRVPVLMLTARDAVSDRIDGLDAGADDYLGQALRRRRAQGAPAGAAAPRGRQGRARFPDLRGAAPG